MMSSLPVTSAVLTSTRLASLSDSLTELMVVVRCIPVSAVILFMLEHREYDRHLNGNPFSP